MRIPRTGETNGRKPLRLWPGVVIVALQWLARFGLPMVDAELSGFGVLAGLAGGLAIVVWWVFFSRARWSERLGGVGLMAAALIVTLPLLHESMATGAMGLIFYVYAVPLLSLAFVAWALAARRLRLTGGVRWTTMAAALLLACGVWTLVRTGGITGNVDSDFAWRWSETPEDRLLAGAGDGPAASAVAPAAPVAAPAAWPGFRGPGRDGVVPGVRIATDWAASPPVELWRRPVGPGWSSFAVHGDLVYTQEQRGAEEVVACYRAATGEPVWQHRDGVRFWESNGGAGPRGTPTLAGGRVYAFGATGILNALDARDGARIWSRDVAIDAGVEVPDWGFSSSPLVVDDVVIVAAAGRLVGYERANGEPRWLGPDGGGGYSSPHRLTIDGVEQVVLLSGTVATSLAPADGALLWQHDWGGGSIVQPNRTADGDLLMGGGQSGMHRIAVERAAGGWSAEERWASNGLKPYYNDFVVHRGHAFGFDGGILAAIDLADGKRRWKGGRYGHGQLVLLADQDLLLVVSERGELALVAAKPDRFTELARLPAIEGKTWNHPVVVGELLLVRNAEEMAAFRLPLAAG